MSVNHKNPTKVVTGVVRLSYANVWEPASINGSNPKYSVSLIIPKTDTKTIDAINAAVDAAIKDGAAKFGGKIPNKAALKLPLRDGDLERDDEAYKGAYFVNANSTTAPQIVDRSVQPILDRAEVYSGCYARVSINFYAYNSAGKRGVGCGLRAVMKTRDGEPLSNSVVTAAEFAGVGGVQPQAPAQGYATGQYGAAMPATPVPGYGGYPAGGVQPQAGYTPGQINPITGQPM